MTQPLDSASGPAVPPDGNSVHRFLDDHLTAGHGDALCAVTEHERVTYREMHARACRAANAFAAAGVGYETRVALVLPDSPDYLACVLGLLRLGAVPVPLSTQLTTDDYARIFSDCRPRLAVVGPAQLAAVRAAPGAAGLAKASWPREIWVAADKHTGPEPALGGLLAEAAEECPVAPVSVDDMAVIQYTSGSTGAPRGVVHLHRGLLAVLDTFPVRLGLTRGDLCLSAAKLSFGYGFGNSFLFPLAAGAATLLMPEPAEAARVLRLVAQRRPTVLCAVPALYSAMLTVVERSGTSDADADLSSVRRYVSAGEPLPPSLAERWHALTGVGIVNGLGSTECLHIFIATEPGTTPPGSSGTVVPGFEAELRDEQGRLLGPGETGHLWVRGEANAARYWNDQPATRATMAGGWNRTGDQLSRDADGVFTFVARSDDVLKVGGYKVAPTEIEDCLLRHPAVAECAVVGVPGPHATTEVIAYVRPHDGGHGDEDDLRGELRAHVRAGLARFKQPRTLRLVDALPRTSTGKIARHALRGAAREAAAGTPGAPGTPGDPLD
ncbi:benzoate-CoA ligase family protein [Streptomyces armeniacus]|uniref:Benzoate-CoA ligase family protein n=1 Tax=Streptomyces armeniacus TaxID=83291 RepID=A0A345XT96_9ACTN|nr:benzoate-CoA ligase family protein [Streptomyces armeniacus]AXK34862.1 benzoate-CoA ligase family protein [Streptomyces armeniacus]